MNNNSKLTKLLKVWWKHVLFILFRRSSFQQMLNNFVTFELLFTKLSGIHPYEKNHFKFQMPKWVAQLIWLVQILNKRAISDFNVKTKVRYWKAKKESNNLPYLHFTRIMVFSASSLVWPDLFFCKLLSLVVNMQDQRTMKMAIKMFLAFPLF